jgi:flavin-dependent dehydrogenase
VIAGGGPAGCATALALRIHAPELSVALIEQTSYRSIRPGEVLPGAARSLLDCLHVWPGFERHAWRSVYATAAAWGSPVVSENHSLYATAGNGWHLDRARFDLFLAEEANARGVTVYLGKSLQRADKTDDGWSVVTSGNVASGDLRLRARFLADATGRAATIARGLGGSVVSLDALTGFSRFFPADEDSDPHTLIESVPDGWWYTAALSDNRRVVTLMADADIARPRRLDREPGWRKALSETMLMKTLAPAAEALGEVVRPAGSAYLNEPCGDSWIAAGDACCAHDPLSGQGITRALRSGIMAAYAIVDTLCKNSPLGMKRYRHLIRHGWSGYLSARNRFYAEERRWPGSLFWQRRQGTLKR